MHLNFHKKTNKKNKPNLFGWVHLKIKHRNKGRPRPYPAWLPCVWSLTCLYTVPEEAELLLIVLFPADNSVVMWTHNSYWNNGSMAEGLSLWFSHVDFFSHFNLALNYEENLSPIICPRVNVQPFSTACVYSTSSRYMNLTYFWMKVWCELCLGCRHHRSPVVLTVSRPFCRWPTCPGSPAWNVPAVCCLRRAPRPSRSPPGWRSRRCRYHLQPPARRSPSPIPTSSHIPQSCSAPWNASCPPGFPSKKHAIPAFFFFFFLIIAFLKKGINTT